MEILIWCNESSDVFSKAKLLYGVKEIIPERGAILRKKIKRNFSQF